ncbi:hypothetical protein BGP78_20325 [Pseudoalteromonas sp. MSK9-3]|uniref:hypothetical protein n=1 Tax=Pseudoalteromonas sp. MSK9-3 TaxID=1897633 RepID=UPI000E6B61B9|nr:hypothetical protein [Pseudoalteromonas sp. MSK9-3]RJE72355.1 hypothetical protein BGP78_20325 [Pseudoalteromonas sp. MSK9-3]
MPNRTGATMVHFEPPLRRIPAPNTTVNYSKPVGVFRLANNKQGVWQTLLAPGVLLQNLKSIA